MLENHTAPTLLQDLGMIFPNEKSKQKKRIGLYKCSCGKEFKAQQGNINNGHTKSCGCLSTKTKTKHGLCGIRAYGIWVAMISRCYKVNQISYKNYGARGIKVCDEWKNDPKIFIEWAMNNGYSDDLTLDRKNNDGNYEPSNCRWATKSTQTQNSRRISRNNTSGYRGVIFLKQNKKWRAQIQAKNHRRHIGLYNTAIEAAQTYDNYVTIHNLEHTKNFS